jgi:hypothetical protein
MGSSLSTPITEVALNRDLTPCDPAVALRLLGPLFRNLKSYRTFDDSARGESERREAMAVYVRPLAREPAWAIELAVQRFLDGDVDRAKSRYGEVPMSDEFAREVRRLTEWAREQEAKRQRDERIRREHIAAIEGAKPLGPMSPEVRAKLDAFLQKSKEAMK